jgi:hypothetical protein
MRQSELPRLLLEVWPAVVAVDWRYSITKLTDSISMIFFYFYLCGETLGTAATTVLLYQLRMIGDGDCGEIGGIKIGRRNRSTRRKPAAAPLCPPQLPHD